MCHNTHVIPFRLTFLPGVSLYEQVVFAAQKAIVSRQILPGDPFPSVRTLSRELKINPNTAQKVIAHLTQQGLLEVRPGIGTVVADPPPGTKTEQTQLLNGDLERLVVTARRYGLTLADLQRALSAQWTLLDHEGAETK